MYTHFKILKNIAIGCVLLFHTTLLFSQQASVSTTITPLYDVPFDQLKSQIMIMITNTSATDPIESSFLRMYLEGDNGIIIQSISSFDYINPIFDIDKIQTLTLNGISGDLDELFEIDNLTFVGISENEVYDNGLPDGNYSLCFRVFNSDFVPISQDLPAGCSMFTILPPRAIEPPQLIAPICGNEITTGNNNIVFSWTIPPGADPTTIDYTLKMIELLPNQDPNQAFLSSTVPAFFEKNVQMQNSILYGPTDPPLESGKRYAWQVIANDVELNTPFENDGRSEVCWFTWKPNTLTFIPLETKPTDDRPLLGNTIFQITPRPTPVSSLSGTLLYKFKETTSGFTPSINPNVGSIAIGDQKPNVPNTGYHVNPAGAKPLAGVSVSLVVTYLFNGKDNDGSYNFKAVSKSQASDMSKENKKSQDQVLATTITNGDGNFKFEKFINPFEEYGLVQSDIDASTRSDVKNLWTKGDVYRVLRLKVNNQYYLSPDMNIVLHPLEDKNIGKVVSLVKSYNLTVIPKWYTEKSTSSSGILSKINVYVTRSSDKSTDIPDDEGSNEKSKETMFGDVVGNGTTGAKGITFTNLVRHNYSDLKDRYTIIAAQSDNSLISHKNKFSKYVPYVFAKDFPYTTKHYDSWNSNNIEKFLGEKITWNSELKIKTFDHILYLKPDNPNIFGKLELAESKNNETRVLSNEKVILLETYYRNSNKYKLNITRTDVKGRYRFTNLSVEEKKQNGSKNEVIGPARSWWPNIQGFFGNPRLKVKPIMNWGEQIPEAEGKFQMIPDGLVAGYVEDEEGNPIKAIVNVDSLAMSETTTMRHNNNGRSGSRQSSPNQNRVSDQVSSKYRTPNLPSGTEWFKFKAPSGQRSLHVRAVSGNELYAPIDTILTIPNNENSNKLFKIVLLEKKKRVRFKVVEYKTTKPVANAKVTLEKGNPSLETTKLTDSKGYVTFVFSSNVDDFEFTIAPPDTEKDNYTEEIYSVRGLPNTIKVKNTLEHAYLKKMAKISGMVISKGKPLEGVGISFLIGNEIIETKTDNTGKYDLKGIAQEEKAIELKAIKSGYITVSKDVQIKAESTVNFDLKQDKEFVMTNIFGINVDIVSKKKQSDGTYIITEGYLKDIPTNDNFKTIASSTNKTVVIPFHNLKVKKNGVDNKNIPLFEPIAKDVLLSVKTLKLIINSTFTAFLGEESQALKLTNNNGKGEINGQVVLHNKSFKISQGYLNFGGDKEVYLTENQNNSIKIKTIAVDNPIKNKFSISNKDGKELHFKLGSFKARAVRSKSYLTKNKVVLYTHLMTEKIESIIPEQLDIEAGEITLFPDKLIPIDNKNPLKIKLEKWNFISKNWTYSPKQNRIEMAGGTIKTGTIDVPVSNVNLYYNNFDIGGKFQLDGLNIAGVAKLNVQSGGITSFDLNPSTGSDKKKHWELKITGPDSKMAATISLPGFESGKPIGFASIQLLSNGEQFTTMGANKPIKFYNIIDVTPDALVSGDGYIDISTTTDLGIPGVPIKSGYIRFTKENGQVKADVSPILFSIDIPGKVTLTASDKLGNTEIRDGFFKAKGKLKDHEGINLLASVTKTTSKTNIVIEPGQNMKLGGTSSKFKDIKGGVELNKNNDWEKLSFSGELDGFKGVSSGQRQTFTVHGAITADNESIDVDNIETPFGDLALTFDIKNSRFLGHLNIDQPLGGMRFKGAVDFLMGGDGWYFMAGGTGTPPGIGEISAGLIVGDSDYLAPDVTGNIMQFAYDKNVPPTIRNGVSGLFLTGQKVLPIINVPDFSVNLAGIVKASLGAKAGLDARIWMNFDSGGDEFGIGVMAFAHVYFRGGSIVGTTVSADARAEVGIKGLYQTRTKIFHLTGCSSITISGSVEQCFPVAGCTGVGFSKGIKIDLKLDSEGNTDMSFGFDNCSGAPLTSGW